MWREVCIYVYPHLSSLQLLAWFGFLATSRLGLTPLHGSAARRVLGRLCTGRLFGRFRLFSRLPRKEGQFYTTCDNLKFLANVFCLAIRFHWKFYKILLWERPLDPDEALKLMAQEVQDCVEADLNSFTTNISKVTLLCFHLFIYA